MDLETASALETLRSDLDRAKIDLGDRIASTEDALRAEMREMRDGLRAEMRQLRDEVMRHAAVLTESVRDDVRIVADGVASVSAGLMAVSAKIDALKR
jgi:hypothetical protein